MIVSPDPTIHLRTTFGLAQIVPTAGAIDPALWKRGTADDWKDERFYLLLEKTLAIDFRYFYLVVSKDSNGETALLPFFLVDQDLVAALPPLARAAFARLRRLMPRLLRLRMLTFGCPIGDGQLGDRQNWAVEALAAAADEAGRRFDAPIILWKDFSPALRDVLRPLSKHGYRRVAGMPGARLNLDFESFEEYMETKLSRVFRKNLRRKLRNSAKLASLEMTVVNDVSAVADQVYELYLQTFDRSKLHFEKLTPDFFREFGTRMPDRVLFFLWRLEGRMVAFNLCIRHDTTLHDVDIGLDYAVALRLHLYFVTWRDVIEWSLRNGVKTYVTGPLNYDPKLHLRLRLVPQDLYVRHRSRLLNPLFHLALRYLQPARHDALLRRFENRDEL